MYHCTQCLRFSLTAILLLAATSAESLADPITYTERDVAKGSLNGVGFTGASILITFVGDTSNVVPLGGGFFQISVGTATLSINGGPAVTFTDSLSVFDNGGGFVGVADNTVNGSILDTQNAAFNAYDLTTSIGPISGPSFIRPDLTFGTTGGGFNIASDTGTSTFQAVVGAAVPEPASFLLMGSGLLGLVAARRVRKVWGRKLA